ncbi:helix-turn-helix domain-containing protein, partial [Dubosiella newyorkensis]
MKANEVMKILQISRSTLLRWRKDGILKANKL